jgi:hypothetical protein
MLKKPLFLLLLLSHVIYADFDYMVNNSNFTISQGSIFQSENETYMYNYNRLRFRGDYTDEGFFGTIIADGVNYLGDYYINSASFEYIDQIKSDTSFKTKTNDGPLYAKLYRLYGGYEDSKNRAVIGLQNISMGVGRIWTPTDMFNPKNSYALESDEVYGVAALSYTRYLSDTSHVNIVASQKADNSFKYAGIYKVLFGFAEIGIDAIISNETKMIGYEIEGNLADTGIELRSEGAYIQNSLIGEQDEKEFFQGIVGADYGFKNGVTLVLEALYSSDTFSYQQILQNIDSEILSNLVYSNLYTAISLSYSFNMFLDTSLLYIESFNDKNSRFISPSITYTLNDNNSFIIGAMIQNGDGSSEFGSSDNTYYFKWALSF